jgi:hypothetical protein
MGDNLTFAEALALTIAHTRGRDEPSKSDLNDAEAAMVRINDRRVSHYGLKPFGDHSAPIKGHIIIEEVANTDE